MENNLWLSITDYSHAAKVSVSTIRRHIKSKKLTSKKIDGKYLILNGTRFVKNDLKNLKEEIAELKMLINLYESERQNHLINSRENLPEIPQH